MDRRLLFPIAAVTAWAQQPSPEAAAAEAELRARVNQFFQLQADKKYRQAESMVAEDTKDYYYNGSKFNIHNFKIQSIELLDRNTRAKVTIVAKITLQLPAAGAVDFDSPSTTTWKIEDGQWVWYFDQTGVVATPFGPFHTQMAGEAAPTPGISGRAPDLASLQNLIRIDRNSVVLTSDAPEQTITVSNELPGGVDLELGRAEMKGFKVELEKKHLEPGEKALIRFTSTSGGNGQETLPVLVSPLGFQLDIHVTKQ